MRHTRPTSHLARRCLRIGLALGVALAGQAVFLPDTTAGTLLIVSTTADTDPGDGACGDVGITTAPSPLSLREATCLANNIGGDSTISVPAGVYTLVNGELRLGDEPDQDTTLAGAGAGSTVIDAGGRSRVLELDFNLTGGVTTTLSGVTITGGSDDTYGGAGIIAGSGYSDIPDSLTISGSTIAGNSSDTGSASSELPGGGVQLIGGSLTVSDSTISDNSSGTSPGSGVFYQGGGVGGSLTVTGSTFSGNAAGAGSAHGGALATGGGSYTVSATRFVGNTVSGGSGRGAAIWSQDGALTVTGSTFTGNTVAGTGGAVAVDGGSAVLHYNRFTGNSAPTGSAVSRGSATVDATENWWGCTTGPGTAGCDTVAGGPTVSPRLVLSATATPEVLVGRSGSNSTVTATLTQDSAGSAVDPARLAAFDGLPVSWSDPQPAGAWLFPASSNLSAGSAVANYGYYKIGEAGQAVVTLDHGSATAALVWALWTPSVIQRPSDQQVEPGASVSLDAAAIGNPAPTTQWQVSTDGGASFTDIAAASSNRYTFTAQLGDDGNRYRAVFDNGVGSPVTTTAATVLVHAFQAPTITTDPPDQAVNPGDSVSFTTAASGFPTPLVTWYRSTDGGATFSFISGAYSTTYSFTATSADNGNQYQAVFGNAAGTVYSTAATLRINGAPTITSADTATFTVGTAGSFTVTTTGFSSPTLSSAGTLPSGMSLTDNGDGTATLAGTPAAGTGGSYALILTGRDGSTAVAHQSFTLTVSQPPPPSITSADHTTFAVGATRSFTVTTSPRVPAATITETGALPAGVSFTDNGDGTATLAGTPAAGTGGTYPLALTALNPVGSWTQSLALTVNDLATFTSANHDTMVIGAAHSFSVTTVAGDPTETTIAETGPLPAGVRLTDNHDGTAALAGTPAAGTAGSYPLTLSATNGAGTRQQSFTLTVQPPNSAPAITSADHATFAYGTAVSFTVTTTAGYPTATTLSLNGTVPGLSFTDNGDGTATLAGIPSAAMQDVAYEITARNGASSYTRQVFTVTVTKLPTIVSANSTGFAVGSAGSFTVQALGGVPTATTITETGALPTGVTFTDNGNGTATLAGTPAGGTGGSYPLTITVVNAVGYVDQAFTLTVNTSPVITSADHTTCAVGAVCQFSVITTPAIPATTTVTESGSLPAGLTFTGNGGTGILSGVPASGAGGSYPLTFTASNGVPPNSSQTFTLTVTEPPRLTSADHASFAIGSANSFMVTTVAGFPTATTIAETESLPSGMSFTDNHNGTATVAGTPTATGSFPITVTASNGVSPNATQTLTLAVTAPPAITSPDTVTFPSHVAGSFTVTTTGYPTGTLTETGSLPAGVSFTDNHNGTATVAGTPTVSTSANYPIAIKASNGTPPDATQNFTLVVTAVAAVPLPASKPSSNGSLGGVPTKTYVNQVLTVTGTGYKPGAPIEVGWYFSSSGSYKLTVLAHGFANGSGAFSIPVTVANNTGIKTVTSAGVGSNGTARYLSADTSVGPPPAGV